MAIRADRKVSGGAEAPPHAYGLLLAALKPFQSPLVEFRRHHEGLHAFVRAEFSPGFSSMGGRCIFQMIAN
jgi:hypothetical protein